MSGTAAGYEVGRATNGRTYILCYVCGLRSYHPLDVQHLYCERCGRYHEAKRGILAPAVDESETTQRLRVAVRAYFTAETETARAAALKCVRKLVSRDGRS